MTSDGTSLNASSQDGVDFARRITDALDGSGLALLLSLGHQTGLLDTMAASPAPATGSQIAQAAQLNERYVREWLGGMTAACVVDYEPRTQTYWLPEHHGAVLTRTAGPRNLARIAQYIALLGEVEQKILGRFQAGGGLPYSEYPRFHTLMAERSGEVFNSALIDLILPLGDGLPELLRAGADVADFGCGSGHAVNLMAREFSASRFTGFDFSTEAIQTAIRTATGHGLTNANFERNDLAVVSETAAYDLVTVFDVIHDQAQPARVMKNIHRALRCGGTLLMADPKASSRLEDNIAIPMNAFRYTMSLMHCMSVSLAQGGAGLGTMWGRQLAESMLADTGFIDVSTFEIDADPSNYYYIARKS